jgi:hypothetical protein
MTGREFTASLTMARTLRMALASSTEVPPNFMTVGFTRMLTKTVIEHTMCPGHFPAQFLNHWLRFQFKKISHSRRASARRGRFGL